LKGGKKGKKNPSNEGANEVTSYFIEKIGGFERLPGSNGVG
jgi:hypothetical protein